MNDFKAKVEAQRRKTLLQQQVSATAESDRLLAIANRAHELQELTKKHWKNIRRSTGYAHLRDEANSKKLRDALSYIHTLSKPHIHYPFVDIPLPFRLRVTQIQEVPQPKLKLDALTGFVVTGYSPEKATWSVLVGGQVRNAFMFHVAMWMENLEKKSYAVLVPRDTSDFDSSSTSINRVLAIFDTLDGLLDYLVGLNSLNLLWRYDEDEFFFSSADSAARNPQPE